MSTSSLYDVIVVGAGLAGALVARYLADGGMKVVVLEATPAAGGAARCTHGISLVGTPESYRALESRWGRETALHIWDLTYENLHLLKESLRETGHEIEPTGSIRPVASGDELDLWKDSVTLLQQQGYDIDFEDTNTDPFEAWMHTFDDMIFDAKALTKSLLTHSDIIVDYEVEVHDVKARNTGDLAIWGYRRYLWGDRVVLANGIHAIRFQNDLNKILKPKCSHTIDADNVPEFKHPMILQGGNVNIIPAEDSWHISGWGNDEQQILNRITALAHSYCPEATITERCTGWIAQSVDDIPFIGTLPGKPNLFTINGLGPFGASWVFVAASQLANLILKDVQPRFLDITRLCAF